MDFADYINRAELDKDTIKESLPLEYVAEQYGLLLEKRGDRLVGLCPFHDDHDPSFAIWKQEIGDGREIDRCGCYSCDFGTGDVFDFIMASRDYDFSFAYKEGIALYEQFQSEPDWEPTHIERGLKLVDPETYHNVAEEAYRTADRNMSAIASFLSQKDLPIDPDWLHREFRIGALDQNTIVIPHFDGDKATGYKTRFGIAQPYAASSSKFVNLYGIWRNSRNKGVPVILCEGETDTWLTAYRFRNRYDVFGLPTGANQPPPAAALEALKGRDVTLLFDGDKAGRLALRNWWNALDKKAAVVRIAAMDENYDACTVNDLEQIVSESVIRVEQSGSVVVDESDDHKQCYVRATAQGVTIVSDWVLYPRKFLIASDTGERAIEGVLSTGGTAVLRPADLATESTVKRWAEKYGLSWRGNSRDAQDLLNLLMREAPFLARGRMTSLAGWHDGHFVLPGTCIGPRDWVYVPPAADVKLDTKINIGPGQWDRRGVLSMLYLHNPEVTTPILAWLAAAPMRATLKKFPVLGVVGGAGLGKTTLIEEILHAWGWNISATLTATTPHAVHSLAASTNGVPVWFDEYRRGARRETKDVFDQILRDAWDSGTSMKGGLVESNKQILTERSVSAPIIVTGEDAFSETSHLERMALINLPHEGRNAEALTYLREFDMAGFGHVYLRWVIDSYWNGTLPKLIEPPVSDRPAWVLAVLRWGWTLLNNFFKQVANTELPEQLNLSLVEESFAESRASNPIIDVMIWGLDNYDRTGRMYVWINDDLMYVRVRDLVREVRNDPDVQLPGGERAITKWIKGRYRAKQMRTEHGMAWVFDVPDDVRRILSDTHG